MRVAFIIPYFGHLPNYFQLFLDSCEANKLYEWIIITDDDSAYRFPENVKCIRMDFHECVSIFKSRFGFPIALNRPQKLCDFKCSYGYVFTEFLKEYDWWGHCDVDQIFGTLSHFITDEMLERYVKIGSIGHFTLYRNDDKNNRVFMNRVDGIERYKEVFQSERGYGFDEWLPGNVNEIYLQSGLPICLENYGADIDPYRTTLNTVRFDVENKRYIRLSPGISVFEWKDGVLYEHECVNGEVRMQEWPYIHLQKRKMHDKRVRLDDGYLITHNNFCNKTVHSAIRSEKLWNVINYQFFLVKSNSLRIRIKNNNWEFSNIFH